MGTRIATLLVSVGMAASFTSVPALAADDDVYVHQVGTYDYLTQPDFTGLAPLSDAIRGATLGLGTFDGLDGEFVMVAGVPYRVGMDGLP